ncbi:MAG: 30S ribosomal protein S8 [Candidatus Sumerlaeia bacterium]
MTSDPIADMLTRIRNAQMVKQEYVDMPSSRMKIAIAKILKDEGYVKHFKAWRVKKKGNLRIYLKYLDNAAPAITAIERLSKPSRRRYVGYEEIPIVQGGLGIMILSTPKGVLTNRQARKLKVGGELLCSVY